MKYGSGIVGSRIKITNSISRPTVRLGVATKRKGPRMPALRTPWGRISTRLPKI